MASTASGIEARRVSAPTVGGATVIVAGRLALVGSAAGNEEGAAASVALLLALRDRSRDSKAQRNP